MNEKELKKHVKNEFQIVSKDTSGGRSVVFLAYAMNRNRFNLPEKTEVAIKIPRRSSLESSESFEKEKNMLEMLAKSNNPNIIKYHGDISINNETVLFFERATENLRDHRDGIWGTKKSKVDLYVVDEIVKKVGNGLSAIHGLRGPGGEIYLHRDLKPSNILVFPRNEIKISDFNSVGVGIPDENEYASKFSSHGANIHGTMLFLPPEATRTVEEGGREYGVFTDIYSLGLLSYFIVANDQPFERGLRERVFGEREINDAKLETGKYAGYLENCIRKDLEGVISDTKIAALRKALNPDPYQRQQSIEEFEDDFIKKDPQMDPLRQTYETIESILKKPYDTPHGATPAGIIRELRREHLGMLQTQEKRGITSTLTDKARDLIRARAREDAKKLNKYMDKTAEGEYKKSGLESRKDFLKPIAELLMAWGEDYHTGFMNKNSKPGKKGIRDIYAS